MAEKRVPSETKVYVFYVKESGNRYTETGRTPWEAQLKLAIANKNLSVFGTVLMEDKNNRLWLEKAELQERY